MNKTNKKILDLKRDFMGGADMSGREERILREIAEKTGFVPEKVIWRSSYWGTGQTGAVHYLGQYEGEKTVLKIQGVKPEISEIEAIENFSKQNRSKIIRPPKIKFALPWSDEMDYEALILEYAGGSRILSSKELQTNENIRRFLFYYQEYRKNCLPKKPWLPKSEKPDFAKELEKLKQISLKAYPDHPWRKLIDNDLLFQAVAFLNRFYSEINLTFLHGHFSVEDLIFKNDEVILFSNLFWQWEYPFYDAVFGYHWFMFTLAEVPGIKSEEINKQRSLWLGSLDKLSTGEQDRRLLKAALLERAIAGVVLDSLLMDSSKPISLYIFQSTLDEVNRLLRELA